MSTRSGVMLYSAAMQLARSTVLHMNWKTKVVLSSTAQKKRRKQNSLYQFKSPLETAVAMCKICNMKSSAYVLLQVQWLCFYSPKILTKSRPQRTAHLSLSLNSAVVFGITARPPQSQKCNSKQSRHSAHELISALGAGGSTVWGWHKVQGTLASHSVWWELNNTSASCQPFLQGYTSGWLLHLEQMHLKNHKWTWAKISAKHIMGSRDGAVWLLFLFCAQKTKGTDLRWSGRTMLNSVVLRVTMLQSTNKKIMQN